MKRKKNDAKATLSNPDRRRLLGSAAFLGGAALAGGALSGCLAPAEGAVLKTRRPDAPYGADDPENLIYSVCLNCNTGCGVKCRIEDGVLTKLDGNPWNPWTMVPHLSMKAGLDEGAHRDGALCPKGQAAVQTVYDPYRLRTVLKRAGQRGENKWMTVPFARAIEEIVEGGRLFAHVAGEENREVEGLRSLMALRDGAASGEMAAAVKAIWDEKDAAKKKELVEKFNTDFAAHRDALIDPAHPDLGPRNNQFTIAWGRLKGGRSDFIKRFGAGFGTTNLHGHTTVCQGSLYFTCKAISEQYTEEGKFGGGQKFYWQGDIENSRTILFVGANLFEANYGPTNRTVRLTENLAEKRTRIAVADPRYSKLASKAEIWLPIKPGTDAAAALAIIRWMLDNDRYDAAFLRGANKAGAKANNETSWTNATWLVEVKDGQPGKFVRAADRGLAPAGSTRLLVMKDGQPLAFDPNDETTPIEGDLFVDAELPARAGGAPIRVKSGLQVLAESARQRTIEEWCAIAELDPRDVIRVAGNLAEHGKRAVVDIHRGTAQHTDGFYAVLAWMSVNMLLGNFDWKGGLTKGATHSYDGSKVGPFPLDKVAGKIAPFGVSLIRHDIAYEKTTLFAGYPAKRNWYPLSSDIYQEIVPSIGDAYPYPMKALFLYKGTPAYSLPAGQTNIPVLADVARLPLFFTSDITVGTTSLYADYIFPDLSWLERWEFQGSHPNMPHKVQPIRQPAVAPIPESVTIFGEETPISLEAVLMALAERLGMKAFGPGALGDGADLNRPEDFYLRAVANIAVGSKPVAEAPAADAREQEIFERARRHLPKSVFDAEKWRALIGEELWPRVVYLLNRGGRFDAFEKGWDGAKLANRYGALLNLYQEKTAGVKHAGDGKNHPGYATWRGQRNFAGVALDALADGHDLHLITHRTVTMTKSRTIGNYWLLPIMPENGLLMNPADARRLGIENGEKVRVLSATNPAGVWDLGRAGIKPIEGKLVVTKTIRPGVVSFALGFGHWATGGADFAVDGETIRGDARRAAGFHANAAMWTDPSLRNNTCLVDPVGGSVSFYDTKVRVERV